ncbi:hypothetical protein YTPLAS18_16700 [Nitrospira sp.]|nr:hypothetical protein YTPLAS18_16700 [Nitrospira sp.]
MVHSVMPHSEDEVIRLKLLHLVQKRGGAMTHEDAAQIESSITTITSHIGMLVKEGYLYDDKARGVYRLTERGGHELMRLMRARDLTWRKGRT